VYRRAGLAEDSLNNHECRVEADANRESGSKISRPMNVTTRPMGVTMIVRSGLVGMVVVMIVRTNGEIL
jgi:hypothetical protein